MSSLEEEWVRQLTNDVASKVKAICEVWAEIGIDGARLQARKESLQSYLFSMLEEMHDEELAAQQALLKSIKELQVKIDELETELGFPDAPLPDALTLVLTEKTLYDRFKSLEERAVSITENFNSLRQEEEQLAARLGEHTTVILFKHAPNQQQMRSLKANIDYLTMEKRSRVFHLSELRQDIAKIHAAIEDDASLDADLMSRLMRDDALDTLPLSTEFLAEVEALRQKCDHRLSEIEAECVNLSTEVLSLAGRLNLQKSELLNLDEPVSVSFLNRLKEEVQRLAELRRQNLSTFIENCRNELHQWWDACYLSEPERDLLPFDANEYTEAVLEAFEAEIDKWKAFHATHEPLFEAVKEWQTTFARFRETEMKKKDPIILKNRGGILLTVEKEFKQLQRDLRRLDASVQQLAENPTHSDVLVHGMHVMNFLEASRRQYDEDKENEVKLKKELQKKITENEQRFGCGATRVMFGKRPGTVASLNQTKSVRSGPNSARGGTTAGSAKKPRLDATKDTLSSFASNGTSTLSRELCGSPVASSSFRESDSRTTTPRTAGTPRFSPITPKVTGPSSTRMAGQSKAPLSTGPRTRRSGHMTKTPTAFTSRPVATTPSATPTRQFIPPVGCPPRSARKFR